MDFLKKFTEATKIDDTKKTSGDTTTTTGAADDQPPSQSDLFASAQVFAEAAKSTIQNNPSNVDNYKLAGATADILDAAEHYGKLDTSTGIGSYVDKAEGYLKQYESSNSPTPKAPIETEPKSPAEAPEESDKKASPPPPSEAVEETEKTVTPPATEVPEVAEEKAIPPHVAETVPSSESPSGDSKIEGKAEEPAAAEDKSGYGSVLKAAGDFWKKN